MRWLTLLPMICCVNVALAGSGRDANSSSCGDYCNDKPLPPLTCDDYLKRMSRKHPDVQFVECKPVMMSAPKVPGFEATYHVEGKDIGRVEAWLGRWAHMKPIKFMCCGWDTSPGYYEDKGGAGYEIKMFADAEVNGRFVDQRKDLAKLPYATLTVTHYLYAP